jgi:signal transduction histidine kinase
LQNLLHNGVRHTSPGGIVAIVVTMEAQTVCIRVKDTGEGITPEDLPRIWERFYQTNSARTRTDRGAGLGLSLVKEWIEAMGGTACAESVVGAGSCFTLSLPQAQRMSEPYARAEKQGP